jgi:protein-disulfide isomerase
MPRWDVVSLFKSSLLVVLAICLGCSAQSTDPATKQRIEHQVRNHFGLPPNVQISVGERRASEFPTYDTVAVTISDGERKQATDFLLSKDGKTLMRLTKLDMTTDPYTQVMNRIDLQGRPVRGSKDAKVTIVNYDDFQCPFCSRMHQTLSDIAKSRGDKVRIIYKDYPLAEIHPWATRAAVDANCLSEQSGDAYWEFVDYIHANPREVSGEKRPMPEQFAALDRITLQHGQKRGVDMAKLQSCVKAQVTDKITASVKEASELGVEATPTMFINGERVAGALPPPMMQAVIDRALQEANGTSQSQSGAQPTAAAK